MRIAAGSRPSGGRPSDSPRASRRRSSTKSTSRCPAGAVVEGPEARPSPRSSCSARASCGSSRSCAASARASSCAGSRWSWSGSRARCGAASPTSVATAWSRRLRVDRRPRREPRLRAPARPLGGHRLAVHDHPALVDPPVGHDERVRDEAPVIARARARPGSAGRAAAPCSADQGSQRVQLSIACANADVEVEEVGRAAVGRRAVPRPGLPEAREVGRDREIARHADLLAAADAQPVDAVDHRLVAR